MKFSPPSADLVVVGKIKEPKGLKGDLKVHLLSGEATWQEHVKDLLLKKNTSEPQTFHVQNIKIEGRFLIVKVDGISDRTQAEEWSGAEVLISAEHFKSKPGEKIFLGEVLGFNVYDRGSLIGKVVDFGTNQSQDLLVVERKSGHRVLIPLIQAFLLKIDAENQKVEMDLPPGLVEMNS